jgi:hypothetical protein
VAEKDEKNRLETERMKLRNELPEKKKRYERMKHDANGSFEEKGEQIKRIARERKEGKRRLNDSKVAEDKKSEDSKKDESKKDDDTKKDDAKKDDDTNKERSVNAVSDNDSPLTEEELKKKQEAIKTRMTADHHAKLEAQNEQTTRMKRKQEYPAIQAHYAKLKMDNRGHTEGKSIQDALFKAAAASPTRTLRTSAEESIAKHNEQVLADQAIIDKENAMRLKNREDMPFTKAVYAKKIESSSGHTEGKSVQIAREKAKLAAAKIRNLLLMLGPLKEKEAKDEAERLRLEEEEKLRLEANETARIEAANA